MSDSVTRHDVLSLSRSLSIRSFLGLFAHVEEALDDEIAIVDELPFKQTRRLRVQANRAARPRHGKIARVAQKWMRPLAFLALVRERIIVHESIFMASPYQLLSKMVMVPCCPTRSQ